MKKIACFFLAALVAASWAFCKPGDTLYVSVKEKPLKNGTGFFAKTTGTVRYGDVVIVVTEKGGWFEVRGQSNSSIKGWIPSSAVTTKKIIAGKTVSTSASEIALAGKGFSPEAEQVLKNENPEKRYDLVDQVEQTQVDEGALESFVKTGSLTGGPE